MLEDRRRNGQMDGWMDEWLDGWMDEWIICIILDVLGYLRGSHKPMNYKKSVNKESLN